MTNFSDLAVSPFAMPLSLQRGEVRVAFAGRTSTEDQQDPRQSLIRQLERSKSVLPPAWAIVAHFYDVESGRKELAQRGHGANVSRFDIPIARDGGIDDLLAEAASPDRRFDVVICETVSRTARRMYENMTIERELERAGVPLFAWNEPIKIDGSRASQILQRRINQSVAEYEVLNTLETSWGGLCTHVREGWNIGKPPYGYQAKSYRHPNPAKADRGATKSRLEPQGARGETVTEIANWRYHEGLGYGAIADRLNVDLDKYPPPEPPGGAARARGAWSKSTVSDLLRNPKYTGYQVFNRRASRSRRGAVNEPEKWVWSSEPVHEPLIPKWMFDELAKRRSARKGSRSGNRPNRHPATRHSYVLRGMLFCTCGRRMYGNARKYSTYYLCWPKANNRGAVVRAAAHSKAEYVNESAVLDAVSAFYADRVFGPERRELFESALAGADDHSREVRDAERERLSRGLVDLSRRQDNVLRQAQECEPGDPFAAGLRRTYRELEEQRVADVAALAELEKAAPGGPRVEDAALLDALPVLALSLREAPGELLRKLFEVTDLAVRVQVGGERVEITVRMPVDRLEGIGEVASTCENPAEGRGSEVIAIDAVRAPGRIRTCAPASGGRCSIP